MLNQVGDDLAVSLADKSVLLLSQPFFQLNVVLNDAVMHHHNLSSAITVWMGILFCRMSMRGPAGMSDSISPVQRVFPDHLFKVAELARRAPDLQAISISSYCNSRGVITAILEAFQAIQDDWHSVFTPDISNNAAHTC